MAAACQGHEFLPTGGHEKFPLLITGSLSAVHLSVSGQFFVAVDGHAVGHLRAVFHIRLQFGPRAAELLRGLCSDAGQHNRLFRNSGTPLLGNHFHVAWKNAREYVQEIGPGWHQLRHFHASALISKGFSPLAVAARLGHKDANDTVRTYSHLWFGDDDQLAEVAEELFSLLEAGA